MASKKIYYKVTGRNNEDYIFLDRNETTGEYTVRVGEDTAVSHFRWEGEETVFSVEDFLASNPKYTSKVQKLISEFEAEL
jgi:hypothetical protein